MVCSVSRLAVGVSAWTIASASINRPRSAGSARINVYCQISASIPCLLRLLDTLNEGCLGLIVPPALPFPARYRPVSFPDVSRNMSRMVGVSGRAKLTCASGHVSRCVTQKTAAPVRVPPFSVSSSRTIGVSVARIGIAYALGCGVVVLALKLYPDEATLDPCRRYSGAAASHEGIEYRGSRHREGFDQRREDFHCLLCRVLRVAAIFPGQHVRQRRIGLRRLAFCQQVGLFVSGSEKAAS